MKKKTIIALIIIVAFIHSDGFTQIWSLDSCLSYAEKYNKELLSRARHVKASELENKSALSRLLPEITANAALDHYWQIPVTVLPGELIGEPGTFVPVRMGTPWMGSYGLEASLNLVNPQTWQDIKLASLQKQSARQDYETLHKILMRNVKMAYHEAQLQNDNYEATNGLFESYREIHRLITQQFDQGFIDKIAFNQSLALLNGRKDALSKADEQLNASLLALKFWMGFPLENTLNVTRHDELRILSSSDFNPLLLPDYNFRMIQKDLARQQYKASFAALYPSLKLSSSYSRLGFGESLDFISNSQWFTAGFVGLQLRVPIFSLNNIAYNPAKQRSLLKKANFEFELYEEEQKLNFLKQKALMESALESVQLQRENLFLAEENEELSKQKIESGFIDMIQLKQVQESLYLAREKFNQAQLNYIRHALEVSYLQKQ